MEKTGKRIWRIVQWLLIIALLIVAYKVYRTNNFNEYIRAESESGISKFVRDSRIKVSDMDSYKIENTDFNDAMFFKKVTVVPNTPYKVSCMIKTERAERQLGDTDAGAHICINQTTEKSDNVVDTSDWTKVEFLFNSKNRNEVEIGFRLRRE